jgi:hypothetical protein
MSKRDEYQTMTERLAGRYGLPRVQAQQELAHMAAEPGYWRAVYNRAVDLADWNKVDAC